MVGEIRGNAIIEPGKRKVKKTIVASYTSVVEKISVGTSLVNSGKVSGFNAVRNMRMR